MKQKLTLFIAAISVFSLTGLSFMPPVASAATPTRSGSCNIAGHPAPFYANYYDSDLFVTMISDNLDYNAKIQVSHWRETPTGIESLGGDVYNKSTTNGYIRQQTANTKYATFKNIKIEFFDYGSKCQVYFSNIPV